jgi:hypothetical protein
VELALEITEQLHALVIFIPGTDLGWWAGWGADLLCTHRDKMSTLSRNKNPDYLILQPIGHLIFFY